MGDVIKNADPDAVELIPEYLTFSYATSNQGDNFLILRIQTGNLGLFLLPLAPAVAKHVGNQLVEFGEGHGA